MFNITTGDHELTIKTGSDCYVVLEIYMGELMDIPPSYIYIESKKVKALYEILGNWIKQVENKENE